MESGATSVRFTCFVRYVRSLEALNKTKTKIKKNISVHQRLLPVTGKKCHHCTGKQRSFSIQHREKRAHKDKTKSRVRFARTFELSKITCLRDLHQGQLMLSGAHYVEVLRFLIPNPPLLHL